MKINTLKITQTSILAALCFVTFTFLKINIPTPGGGSTAIHFGNIFLVLAALMLGGLYGGLAGAIGMTIADLVDPIYITSAPKTFFLKLIIGLIVGYIAHNRAKIYQSNDTKYILKWSLLSSIAGMSFNVVADPLVGYFYKRYILNFSADLSSSIAKIAAGVTLFNAILTVIIAVLIYQSIRKPMIKAGILVDPRD